MTTLGNIKHVLAMLACSAMLVGTTTVADAGRGGSNSRIKNAISTGSVEAIIAEVERAERLVCHACIGTVMALLDDDRYEVREVAAWWFAKRPAQKKELTDRSIAALYANDAIAARNAADILGAFEHPVAIPALSQAASRTDLTAETRRHATQALGSIGHRDANPALQTAMQDSDASVRLAAVTAWLEIRQQQGAAPVVALVADSDNLVRRKASAVAGSLRDAGARAALEAQLANDSDAVVRRNAAWALGRIGDAASRPALEAAVNDPSPLVRMTAKVAIRGLR